MTYPASGDPADDSVRASPVRSGSMSTSDPGVMAPRAPRVAVIDADRRVQQSLAEVLRVAGVDVVGTAGDVRTALELVSDRGPSVLLVDPRLPDLDAGLALLSSVALGWPGTRIVVMGWSDAGEARLPAGVSFVSKSAPSEEFVSAAMHACGC